ncbi:hypothetical protein H5410_036904 [Solanum commersonii]|uniref:Uncharacterized protein n=1 Tax=Solanum commersonii TaxID=4109 RepID=A0A9J5Y7Y6_SOLCO|nr:hypothetical protein H5410_036904 [Solanum commersonii]
MVPSSKSLEIEEVHSQELPLAIIPDAPSEGEAREHATFRVILDGFEKWSSVSHNPFLSNSTEYSSMEHVAPPVPLCIDTTVEISLANIIPTRGRNRPRSLHKKSMSYPRSESSALKDTPSNSSIRVPQTRQKKCQVEADLISALTATKRTRISTCPYPSVPDIVISDDDLFISKIRRGKHIASKPSGSKPKTSTKVKPKPSPKPASKFKSTKHSTSKSKKHQVASPVPSDSSLSVSNVEYLPQTNPSVSPSQLDRIIHLCKKSVLRGKVVTGFGGPQMVVLLTKLEVQGWSALFLQGDTQRKLAKRRNTPIHLVPIDIARIFGIPSKGWGHYVKLEWPPLHTHTSALSISRKFSSKPNLTHHCGVDKNEMSPLHQFYFDVVHKIILQRKQCRTKANFLDLTLKELLDTEVPIDLPTLIIKYMCKVLYQDENGHALPYGFWIAPIFEAFNAPVQLAAKEDQLLAMENAHQMEKASLEAHIVELQNELSQERAANIATVEHLIQLFHDPKTTSAS